MVHFGADGDGQTIPNSLGRGSLMGKSGLQKLKTNRPYCRRNDYLMICKCLPTCSCDDLCLKMLMGRRTSEKRGWGAVRPLQRAQTLVPGACMDTAVQRGQLPLHTVLGSPCHPSHPDNTRIPLNIDSALAKIPHLGRKRTRRQQHQLIPLLFWTPPAQRSPSLNLPPRPSDPPSRPPLRGLRSWP